MESEGSIDWSGESEEGNVFFTQGPVPSREGSGKNHFRKCWDEEHKPKESYDVNDFEVGDQCWGAYSDVETRRCAPGAW